MADDLILAAEFPPATREDWLKVVRAALKDKPYEDLIARTYDGLAIEPLYGRASKARPIAARGGRWQLLSRIEHPDPDAANADAKDELENGADGLALVFNGAIGDYGFGLAANEATLARALDGVHLDAGVAIDLDIGPSTKDAGKILAALVKSRGIQPAATNIRFGFDPLSAMAAAGGTPMAWRELVPIFHGIIRDLTAKGFRGPFAPADGRVIHAAGGTEAQELAYVLAVAVTYLRALEAGGMGIEPARRTLYFRLAADADQLLTIAKFRAVRKLWARVEYACGLKPLPVFVGAETAWRMMTRRDPWVNMLRTTIAAFSAGLGGADAVTVLPFTAALGLPDRFARRVARNAQLLLLEESNLARVADPAAGSGGIEDLTEQLCGAAWALFQEIESAGGAADALAAGLIQQKIAKARIEHESAVARRQAALIGTSNYPDLAEAPVKVLDVKPAAATPYPSTIKFAPLPRLRLAEPFERLRDASDRMFAENGARPKIFLANLGTHADFNTRAGFAKNFFEAGGIETMTNEGFSSEAEMIDAFKSSGAQLVCLCSSDKVYAQEVVDVAIALTEVGAAHIYLVGRPREQEAAFKAAGVGTFIFSGCDALATLKAAHDILGTGVKSPS